MLQKLMSFTKKVADLANQPTIGGDALKAQFDAAPNELREKLNANIDALKSTTDGDSGADNIGATSISGYNGSNVQAILESITAKLAEYENVSTKVAIYAERSTVSAAVAANTAVRFNTDGPKQGNKTTLWNGFRFTADKAGIYLLNAFVSLSDMPQYGAAELYVYKNGALMKQVDKQVTPGVTQPKVQGSIALPLAVNDYVEFFVYCSAATAFTSNSGISIAQLTL